MNLKVNKIILILRGGLGNQLFTYAAALKLANENNAEILIDKKLGFLEDKYSRKYQLDKLKEAPKCLFYNNLVLLFRFIFYKFIRKIIPFNSYLKKKFLINHSIGYFEEISGFKFRGTLYMDGYFHSEKFFLDIKSIIKKKLEIKSYVYINEKTLDRNKEKRSTVSVHFRKFHKYTNHKSNLKMDYYKSAIEITEDKLDKPFYFIFADHKLQKNIQELFPKNRYYFVKLEESKNNPAIDLWLISQMENHIIANSTFSWWGAWLSNNKNKIVICPNSYIKEQEGYWMPGIYDVFNWIFI